MGSVVGLNGYTGRNWYFCFGCFFYANLGWRGVLVDFGSWPNYFS